ncbi:hypothetical protein MLM_1066 [Mycobacterium lepraemurium]|nr:hypothetical protein [Mycobacterium lepraemurium]ATA27863.1 hypothetical protein MLM_1066 [Mycobacterium lepraemurium]
MTDHGPKYYIEEGLLPDMVCGATHVDTRFQKILRPRYFTAKIRNGVLHVLRLWGPQVLQDGGLGQLELDFRWKFDAV